MRFDAWAGLGREGRHRLFGHSGLGFGGYSVLRERRSCLHQPGGGFGWFAEELSDTAFRRQFEDILAEIRQPARLIGEESGAGPGFGRSPGELRVVLGFPDTYEIGISNQALQILYHLAGCAEGVAVERVYLPWVDAIGAMRRESVPLLTLETWSPVSGADLLGITLQHEFNYTNVLEMLDLAGIPLRAADRGEGNPLVMAGGPACADLPADEPVLRRGGRGRR